MEIIYDTLEAAGFPMCLRTIIMDCITILTPTSLMEWRTYGGILDGEGYSARLALIALPLSSTHRKIEPQQSAVQPRKPIRMGRTGALLSPIYNVRGRYTPICGCLTQPDGGSQGCEASSPNHDWWIFIIKKEQLL